MTTELALPPEGVPAAPQATAGWVRVLHQAESLVTVFVLALMVLLPCAEVLLRKCFSRGVPGGMPMVQHLVLLVSMLGGALAARDNRLLSMSTVSHYLRGRTRTFALIFSHSFGAAICVFLAVASLAVAREERVLGDTVAWGIPKWGVELSLAIGFALIAIRLAWHAAQGWRGRVVAGLLTCAFVGFVQWAPIDPATLRVPGILVLLAATVLGAPIFTALGGAALILLWGGGEAVAAVPQNHYSLTVNPTLPSIPLFTLAGYFLAEGGAARRLVAVFQALFGSVRGGPAIVTVMVCAFFTSFTGASGVTILALGALLMPILLAAGYTERRALGLLTAAGSLGLLFPPCLPPILYSVVASSSGTVSLRMEEMFQGGLLPGILLMGLAGAWGVYQAPASREERPRFDGRVARRAVWDAKWELLIPVVALGFLFSGLATPVESAALTALYAFIVETFVYRDLHLVRDVPRVMTECGLLIGGVMLILGVALGFTFFLILAQIPDKGVAFVTATIHSKLLFLLALNGFLLVVGCLMDIFSAIVVVVPLLVPIAQAFGIDMVHLGIIFLANLELGYLTPPVGMNLFLSSYRFNKPMTEVTRSVLPMLAVLFIGVLLITYFPLLTTWLPSALK